MAELALERRTGRLPAQLTSFVGRRQELTMVRRLLESSRLVTLIGVSGVGKTRLAVRAAEERARSSNREIAERLVISRRPPTRTWSTSWPS